MNQVSDPTEFVYLVMQDGQLPTNIVVDAHVSPNAAIQRSKLQQEDLSEFVIPLPSGRTWDHAATNSPEAPGSDDLGLATGAPGTQAISYQTGDVKTTTISRKAGFTVALPQNYVAGQTVVIRTHAGMLTTVSDGAATIDVECWKSSEAATAGSDICATGAQSIKSLTLADIDFTITPAGLDAGDILEVVVTIAITDTATGTAVIGILGSLKLACDTKG